MKIGTPSSTSQTWSPRTKQPRRTQPSTSPLTPCPCHVADEPALILHESCRAIRKEFKHGSSLAQERAAKLLVVMMRNTTERFKRKSALATSNDSSASSLMRVKHCCGSRDREQESGKDNRGHCQVQQDGPSRAGGLVQSGWAPRFRGACKSLQALAQTKLPSDATVSESCNAYRATSTCSQS